MQKQPYLEKLLDLDKFINYFKTFKNPDQLAAAVQEGNFLQLSQNISENQMIELYNEGHHAFKLQEYHKAAEFFLFLALLDNKRPDFWVSFANSLFFLEKYEDAYRGYAYAILISPEDPQPLYFSGICLVCLNRSKESKHMLQLCLNIAKLDHKYREWEEMASQQLEELERKTGGIKS